MTFFVASRVASTSQNDDNNLFNSQELLLDGLYCERVIEDREKLLLADLD